MQKGGVPCFRSRRANAMNLFAGADQDFEDTALLAAVTFALLLSVQIFQPHPGNEGRNDGNPTEQTGRVKVKR